MTRTVIVGLAASYGPAQNLESVAQAAYARRPLRAGPGASQDSAALALRVAEDALLDAQLRGPQRVMVLVNSRPLLPALLQNLSRRADQWTIVAQPESDATDADWTLGRALVQAHTLLSTDQADAVLSLSLDPHGVGALALARQADDSPQPTYAVIEGLGRASSASDACLQAWHAAGLDSADIGYLEALEWPKKEETSAYRNFGADLTCALSSGAGSPLAALIKAVACLHRRTLPPLPDNEGLPVPEYWLDSPFYVVPQARPWFVPNAAHRRAAVRFAEGPEQTCLLLVEPDAHRPEPAVRPQPGEAAHFLLPIAGGSPAELVAALTALQSQLAAAPNPDTLANNSFATYQRHTDAAYALVIAGHDVAELQHEVKYALEGVPKAFDTGQAWASPRGSYFTPRPLGEAGLTFVYPGAFNAYVGLGRDLFLHFPGLHEHLARAVSDVGHSVAERFLYPRRLSDDSDANVSMAQFAADPAAMIETGIMFAMAFTALLREVFEVRPHAALGYSLGEISMLWAGGVWSDAEAGSQAWRQSSLFRTRLFGPKEAVREAWGLDPSRQDFWHTYLLKAPLAKVQACLSGETCVYLTMINLPDEVVIAGEPEGCRRVISALNCHALQVPYDSVLHNATMRSEQAALAQLFANPVNAEADLTFYSAAHYQPLTLDRDALANDLAHMTCEPLDFPRLVNAAYAGGARVFVELGPQSTCTRWIDRILRGREYAAIPINRPRAGDYEGVLSVLAALVSHRVPVNLAPLYAPTEWPGLTPAVAPAAQPQPAQATPAYAEQLGYQAALLAESHQAFLQTRQTMMQQTAELIHLQTAAAQALLGAPARPPAAVSAAAVAHPATHPPIFDEAAIRAFTTGDPEACFGPAFAIYRGRRLPRLPNGDLLFVNRVTAIEGQPGRIEPGASLVGEYDVAPDAWFLQGRSALPYTALMEIALQPCGLLSAYLGSTLPYPDVDFYFRNLDGNGRLLRAVDVRGQTLTNRVRLLSASTLQHIILQKFEFELAAGDAPFYRGTASFGYFTREALANQTSRSDQSELPAQFGPAAAATWSEVRAFGPSDSKLDLLDRVSVSPQAGLHGRGCVFGEAPIQPSDWYFKCHFYQDPVMPGSLGVETIRQALQAFALRTNPGRPAFTSSFDPLVGPEMIWKYRGQITPQDQQLRLEAHLSDIAVASDRLTLVGDASVWNGAVKVYDVKQVGVTAQLKGSGYADQ
jgi:PfaB family protein